MEANTVLLNDVGVLPVRRLSELDTQILQQLHDECTDFHLLTMGEGPAPTQAKELFTECPPGKTRADKHLFGFFAPKGQLVGVVELMEDYPEPSTWYIGLMMLHPSWRGRGLGKQILKWLTGQLAAKQVCHLCLAVLDVNPRGKKFWEANGFSLIRTVENFKSGKLIATALVLRKALT